MTSSELDLERLYIGKDIKITDSITVHQPTIGEIFEFGGREYFSVIFTLTSVGADMKWQLFDAGIDFTQISDYELFTQYIAKGLSNDKTRILFGDILDFSQMELYYDNNLKENVLIQRINTKKTVKKEIGGKLNRFIAKFIPYFKKEEQLEYYEEEIIKIDVQVYNSMIDVVRKLHNLKRNDEIPANEITKMMMIDLAREDYDIAKNKPYKSQLLSLVSSMVNVEGFKRNDVEVLDMKIFAFMDSVKRIGKIRNATLLLQSGYSGFGVDLKKIDKSVINWTE